MEALAFAILLILGGLAIMAFGLLLFYSIEPYRRILLGISGCGALFGLALSSVFNLDGTGGVFFGIASAVIGGVIGAKIVPKYFDIFIIAATAFSGAALVMAGAHLLLPALITITLAIGVQRRNAIAHEASQDAVEAADHADDSSAAADPLPPRATSQSSCCRSKLDCGLRRSRRSLGTWSQTRKATWDQRFIFGTKPAKARLVE